MQTNYLTFLNQTKAININSSGLGGFHEINLKNIHCSFYQKNQCSINGSHIEDVFKLLFNIFHI